MRWIDARSDAHLRVLVSVCTHALSLYQQVFDGTTEGYDEGRSTREFAPKPIEFSPTLMKATDGNDVNMSMTPDTSMVRAGSIGLR